MTNRYIQRYRLSARQYTAGCPVVLAAGALLEDTQQPRLVAQLKYTSLSDKTIIALTVTVHCLDSMGADLGTVLFSYESLDAQRGQSFGQYTAIVLPYAQTARFRVAIDSVTFADNTVWTMPDDALWGVLPAFISLADALSDNKLLAISCGKLPKGRYSYATPADLWYCTCGGVNHQGEEVCHRCGLAQNVVAQYASSVGLAETQQEQQLAAAQQAAEQERLRQEEAARRKAQMEEARKAAEEKAIALKAAAQEKAEQFKQQRAEKQAAKQNEQPTAAKPSGGKKKWLVLGGFAVAIIAVAGLLLVPKVMAPDNTEPQQVPNNASNSVAQKEPTKETESNKPKETKPMKQPSSVAATGTVIVDVPYNEQDKCKVTTELVRQYIPGVDCISFENAPKIGDNIEPYLIDSFQMAMLMEGASAGSGEWGMFDPKKESNAFCLLAFDGDTHLAGYFIGKPKKADDNTWQLEVTLCDYDFSDLVTQQKAAFQENQNIYGEYIPRDKVKGSGAKYCLQGYYMGRNPDPMVDNVPQTYHLWSELNSPYIEEFAGGLDRIERRKVREGRYMFFILLDKNYEPIGYTMVG